MPASPLRSPLSDAPVADGALGPYVRAVSAHKLLVALCALVAVAGALAWATQREPAYESTAEILVTPLPSMEGDPFQGLPFLREFGDATRTIQTASTLIDNPAAAELAAERLGPGWSRQRVAEAVRVEPQGESQVLAITARAATAPGARELANTYAGAALEVRRRSLQRAVQYALSRLRGQQRRLSADGREGGAAELAQSISALEGVGDGSDPTLSLSERAALPLAALGLAPWLLALLALVVGLTVGTAAALLLELTERRVRDEDELLTVLPAPVLARTPVLPRRARRTGTAPPAVREAFRTLRAQLERHGDRRVVMVTSASSGDGKTTSAVQLAASLAAGGHRVLLIDLDLRKPEVAHRLGMTDARGLVATLTGTPLRELVADVAQHPRLQVVTATGAEGDLVLIEQLRRRLPVVLEEARTLADYVVLDTAPLGEVADALAVADEVDDLVVVARPGHTDRGNLETVRDLLSGAGIEPTGLLLVGVRGGASSTYYTYGGGGPVRGALARSR